jgi:type VI secretion system Hcp family effector
VAAYMKFGTITGDATQKVGGRILIKDPAFLEEQGWISISEFKWVIDRKITTRSGAHGSTRDSKQPAVETFTVNKEADKATSQLLTSICFNNNAETCTIVFVKTGSPGEVYMQYRFSNVFITNINNAYVATHEGEHHTETLTINFTKVEMAHLSSDTTNVLSKSDPDRFEFEAPAGAPSGSGGHQPGGHNR